MTASTTASPPDRYARNTFFVSLGTAVLLGSQSVYGIANRQSLLSIIAPAVVAVVALIAAWMSRRGRSNAGVGLLIFTTLAMFLPSPFRSTGTAFMLGTLAAVLISGISVATLPPRLASRGMLAGIAGGMLLNLIDALGPMDRRAVAVTPAQVAITTGLVTIYAGLLFYQIRKFNIRTKLITTLVIFTLLGSSAVAFFAIRSVNASLTRAAAAELDHLAAGAGRGVADLVGKELDLLISLSLNKPVQDRAETASVLYNTIDRAEITAALLALDEQWRNNTSEALLFGRLNDGLVNDLKQYQQTFPENVQVFVTDKYGALVAATNRTSDYYQADEEWWQVAYNDGAGGVFVGQPEFDESAGAYSLVMAAPIREYNNPDNVVGILRTTLDMAFIGESLSAFESGRVLDVELLFPDDSVFSSATADESFDPATLEQIRASSTGPLTLELDGYPNLVGRATIKSSEREGPEVEAIDNLNWLIIAHQAESVALAPVTNATRTIVLVAIAVVTVTAASAATFARFLSRPILHLTDVAAKVSAGDLTARAVVQTEDEIGALARTFNNTTAQLGELIGALEGRVAERTRALALSAEVSRRLSGILDQKQLIAEVVEQIRSTFNYYHVHIYLYDENREHLVMAGGTGEAARAMLARGHRLEEGRGLVGRAAGTNSPVLVPDVSQDPGWLPNPLLPDTKAEVAVPIVSGARVLGVLDVQHNRVYDLDQDDVQLLQTIANQIAIGLQNTQSYERAQKQAERETFVNAISQKIQSASRIEEVVEIAAQELGQALGAQRAVVQVGTARVADARKGQQI